MRQSKENNETLATRVGFIYNTTLYIKINDRNIPLTKTKKYKINWKQKEERLVKTIVN